MATSRYDPKHNEVYKVEFVRQNEVQDIFKLTNLVTGNISYLTYPRSSEQSCEYILELWSDEADPDFQEHLHMVKRFQLVRSYAAGS